MDDETSDEEGRGADGLRPLSIEAKVEATVWLSKNALDAVIADDVVEAADELAVD